MLEKGKGIFMVGVTLEEFFEMQKEILSSFESKLKSENQILMEELLEKEREKQKVPTKEKKYEYGIKGLAKALNVSRSKATEIKASGDLDAAIFQNGNSIKIDVELANFLFWKNKNA